MSLEVWIVELRLQLHRLQKLPNRGRIRPLQMLTYKRITRLRGLTKPNNKKDSQDMQNGRKSKDKVVME